METTLTREGERSRGRHSQFMGLNLLLVDAEAHDDRNVRRRRFISA